MPDIARIGLVGAGEMGGLIGGHLLRAGWPLLVTDPSRPAQDALEQEGARGAFTPADLAGECDLVLVVVVDDIQTRDVVTGPAGLLSNARPGTIIAICASVHPNTCRELATIAGESGVHLLDVALVGGARYGRSAALTLFCGGPEEIVKACEPVFRSFAINVSHLGDIGAGQVGKTVNNILLWAALRADVEALRLGRAFGVSPSRLRAAAAIGSGSNRVLLEWAQQRLRWPEKDLATALAMAEETGVSMPLVEELARQMAQLSVEDLEELR
ncbi:MAG TPA: NAD(P)-dependent oxidoreductase [Acidimicrobiia bacterium]|nr:NAD(P)-dependent oxidoreductase [Acidimicrobiia bacterium]